MNIQAYLKSGILELYALGKLSRFEREEVESNMLQHSVLRLELERIEQSLEKYARIYSVEPPAYLRAQTAALIDNLARERRMDKNDLPLINKYSSYHNWLKLVEDQLQGQLTAGQTVQVLQSSPGLTQLLLVSSLDFDEEVHEDLHESFLILEGNCRCTVGARETMMGPGDFMEIPLYQPHSVKLLSPVTAILQRIPV